MSVSSDVNVNDHKNSVELTNIAGTDEDIAQAAWTSNAIEIDPERRMRVPALLMKLADREPLDPSPLHSSPFEHSWIQFRMKLDVPTRIQMLRHRVGVSPNEESARYRELKGDRTFAPSDWPEEARRELGEAAVAAFGRYHACVEARTKEYVAAGMDAQKARSRAKETSRYHLPQNSQTLSVWSFNFLSFMHFQRLRNDPHAQQEVREVADEMLRLVRETGRFTHALVAFGWDGPHGTPNRRVRWARAQRAVIEAAEEMARLFDAPAEAGVPLSDARVGVFAHAEKVAALAREAKKAGEVIPPTLSVEDATRRITAMRAGLPLDKNVAPQGASGDVLRSILDATTRDHMATEDRPRGPFRPEGL